MKINLKHLVYIIPIILLVAGYIKLAKRHANYVHQFKDIVQLEAMLRFYCEQEDDKLPPSWQTLISSGYIKQENADSSQIRINQDQMKTLYKPLSDYLLNNPPKKIQSHMIYLDLTPETKLYVDKNFIYEVNERLINFENSGGYRNCSESLGKTKQANKY